MENETKSAEERLNDCLTLADLHDTFTLRELVVLTQDGLLGKWLNSNFLEPQAQMMSSVRGQNRDVVLLALCDMLEIDVTKLSDYEAGQVALAVKNERKKRQRERECGTDGVIVTSQSEFLEALNDENTKKVYMCEENFLIPLNRKNITYDGRGNALINVWAQGDTNLDFDGNKVYFYNLTIVFHFLEPRQVKIDHSRQNNNHIVFLHRNRITRDGSVQLHEMTAFLDGRTPFESAHDFAERAKRFHEIIVGRAYLKDTDYDLWHEAYFLHPIWCVEFIESLRSYLQGAKIVFSIPCEEAKELFERERVQFIYADFGTDKDDALIIRLYLHVDGGKGKIYLIRRLWSASSWAFGSGSGDAGYGLDLISEDNA
ncbi:MAG: hypothetical protein K6G55_04530 [Selenomonadaceae bacterium]|nr:hypothetical protein [Selenomonadaceae bacterium]